MTQTKSSKRRKLFVGSASLEQSQAAELINGNVDLLTEIFLHIPARSLIRFKCVSKHWLTLISDSQFACKHACQNRNSSCSGIYWESQLEKRIKFVSLHGHSSLPTLGFLGHLGEASKLVIISSCNGLMMCSHGRGTPYIVCNLTAQKYTVVPYPNCPWSLPPVYHDDLAACLAFDPSKSPHFKVVKATLCYEECSYEILIYSSMSATWKRLFFRSSGFYAIGHKVFCNGAIHWICKGNIHFRFELDAEELIETPLPPKPKILGRNNIRYFEECRGRLLLIQIWKFSAEGFRILEMDSDYGGWTVKCRVNLRPVIAPFPETVQTSSSNNYSTYREEIWKFSVLSVFKEANKEDYSLLLGISGTIISYNLKTKMWKVLHEYPAKEFPEYFYGRSVRGHQFIESLSPV